MDVIVVGVDGSRESERAVAWAVAEARLRDATLRIVYVYEHRPAWQIYGYAYEEVPTAIPEGALEADRASAEERAQTLVDRMADAIEDRRVEVEAIAYEDRRPARALVELSEAAQLLVVGSRGRGGFAGLVLGSVSQQCVQHARCPVVVMPTGSEGQADG